MKFGCLTVGGAVVLLVGVGFYFVVPRPIHDQEALKSVAAEAQRLIAAHESTDEWVRIPKSQWPPMIARLKPVSVWVGSREVNIMTRPYFDGGWGYGYARNKQDLGMLPECWSSLGHDVYWHGPC